MSIKNKKNHDKQHTYSYLQKQACTSIKKRHRKEFLPMPFSIKGKANAAL